MQEIHPVRRLEKEVLLLLAFAFALSAFALGSGKRRGFRGGIGVTRKRDLRRRKFI
jgi:hypothetical protein